MSILSPEDYPAAWLLPQTHQLAPLRWRLPNGEIVGEAVNREALELLKTDPDGYFRRTRRRLTIQMDKSERWFLALFGMLLATLLMIGICDSVGVGHFWPFPVLISMLVADVAVGIKAIRSGDELRTLLGHD